MAMYQRQIPATKVREFAQNHANMHPYFSQRNRRPVADRLTVPHVWLNRKIFPQDAQKGCPARPQQKNRPQAYPLGRTV